MNVLSGCLARRSEVKPRSHRPERRSLQSLQDFQQRNRQPDDAGGLHPQSAVQVGPEFAQVGFEFGSEFAQVGFEFGSEFAQVGFEFGPESAQVSLGSHLFCHSVAQGVHNGGRLRLFKSRLFQGVGSSEGVERGGLYGTVSLGFRGPPGECCMMLSSCCQRENNLVGRVSRRRNPTSRTCRITLR